MTEQVISPLRRRMIEDMTIRKFGAKTQHDYVRRVKELAAFLGRSPDTARAEDVRRFQLHLASSGAGTPKTNATSLRCGSSSMSRSDAPILPGRWRPCARSARRRLS